MSGSGFESAGIVLGTFSIALSALELCRDVSKQIKRFLQIKLDYKKWRESLEFQKLAYTHNLKQLLLPLALDDDKIDELLLAPGGDCWRENSVAERFEQRLGQAYTLYMTCIQGMGNTMKEINRELAVDAKWAQQLLDSSVRVETMKMRT